MNSGFEDENLRFNYIDIGRFTKFSKQQNEKKISGLNLIKNATNYRKPGKNLSINFRL